MRTRGKIYVAWQADADDNVVIVLVDAAGISGTIVFTEQISAALSRNWKMIEELASVKYRPGDRQVFLEAENLASISEQAVSSAP